MDDQGDPSLKTWSGHPEILTPRGQMVVDRQEDDVISPPGSSSDGMGSSLYIEETSTSVVDLTGIDEILSDESFEVQVRRKTQTEEKLDDKVPGYLGVQEEDIRDTQTQDDVSQDTESGMVGDIRVVPDNTTVVPSSGKKREEIENTVDDDDSSQDARGHHGGDLISVVIQDDDRQGSMSGGDDDNVVSNITTVTPSSGKSHEEVGNTVDDDDRNQNARGHRGGDLISSVRQDDDRQGAVSGGEGDNVVSHITTVTPSMGEKRGSDTGKDKALHNNDIPCTEVPDGPRAIQRMVIDDDQPQLPGDTVENTGGPAVPVQEVSSYPSTSPRDPPATQRGVCVHSKGGVCSIHGPGAKLRWRFGGK